LKFTNQFATKYETNYSNQVTKTSLTEKMMLHSVVPSQIRGICSKNFVSFFLSKHSKNLE